MHIGLQIMMNVDFLNFYVNLNHALILGQRIMHRSYIVAYGW